MNDDAKKDCDFLAEIIAQICDYAVDNGINPTDTVITVAKNLFALTKISNFDNWKRRDENG